MTGYRRSVGSNPTLSAKTHASRGFLVLFELLISLGEVPEWLNGAVSKTVVRFLRTEGSNPSLSARFSSHSH